MTWDQDYLKNKHLLIIGCGGLAHAALPYLLSSGVGKITLFDGDMVEITNLNRQHLFTPSDVGRNKATVLEEYCSRHFPEAEVKCETRMFTADNKIVAIDLAFDFTDRLATKLTLADYFEKQQVPFFYSAAQSNTGCSAFVHLGSVCAEILFGHIQDSNKVERDCASDGVWPTVVAAVGIHVAHQALQFLTLSPCSFIGAVDYFDGVSGLWSRFQFTPKREQPKSRGPLNDLLKDPSRLIYFLGDADSLPNEIISITASELKETIENSNRPCILVCETGLRAKTAAEQLSKRFNFPVLSWNKDLHSFLQLLNENHV